MKYIPKKCGSSHRSHRWKVIDGPYKNPQQTYPWQEVQCIDCNKKAYEQPPETKKD